MTPRISSGLGVHLIVWLWVWGSIAQGSSSMILLQGKTYEGCVHFIHILLSIIWTVPKLFIFTLSRSLSLYFYFFIFLFFIMLVLPELPHLSSWIHFWVTPRISSGCSVHVFVHLIVWLWVWGSIAQGSSIMTLLQGETYEGCVFISSTFFCL